MPRSAPSLETREERRRPPAASLLVTAAGALVCSAVLVGVGFALESTLGRPLPLVRVAAATPAAAGRSSAVWSIQVLDGRRVQGLCRSYRLRAGPVQSLVLLSDGGAAFSGARGVRLLSGRRAGSRLELEAILAGCSADVVRMLAHEIQPRFAQGVPVSLARDVRDGVPVYSIALMRGDLLIELSVDRRTLAPFDLQILDGKHVGRSRLYVLPDWPTSTRTPWQPQK